MDIRCVDICCGLNWGDEAKGKIIAQLSKSGRYQFVCRWAGGHNAGHTVYVNGNKYKTHLIPCGIFYQIPSIIGPDCVVHETSFLKEIETLQSQGFDTSLVKISPNAHVVTDVQIQEDAAQYNARTSTGSGISQCYRDKYARIGKRVCEIESLREYIWNGVLYGNVLCEGAQGFWLDINQGYYPYVTSSTTLPYGACSLGFPPQCIRTVYGVTKIYDTRAGTDPLFPDTLFDNPDLNRIIEMGKEYGTTTGKKRKVNWLNVDKLIDAIRISGAMQIIVSKTDVLEQVGKFKMYYLSELRSYSSLDKMKSHLEVILTSSCERVEKVFFSGNIETVDGLLDSDLIIPH
jgi:adenylosuccinate synthase